MGFIRNQQEKLALKFLAWRHTKEGLPLPALSILRKQASDLVDEARAIAKKRGANIVSIIKELADDIKS
jgi:hypothetical protein